MSIIVHAELLLKKYVYFLWAFDKVAQVRMQLSPVLMNNHYFSTDAAIVMTPRKTLLIGWGDFQRCALPTEDKSPQFYISDFFLSTPLPWIQFEQYAEVSMDSFEVEECSANLNWDIPEKEEFIKSVEEVIAEIRRQNIEKAVPYLCAKASLPLVPEQRERMLKKACKHASKHSGFVYGFWIKNEGMIGASPEQLFIREGNMFSTLACAGTASSLPEQDSAKIFAEHRYVVDGIVNCLSKVAEPVCSEAYWKKSGASLYHLVTPIQAKLKGVISYEEAIKMLHPTPAIGTYPKEQGRDWLKSYDRIYPRGRYGAPIGYRWQAREEELAYVAIRNVQWQNDELKLFAGCGVVESSNPEEEWNEWLAKFSTVKALTGL